MDVEEWLYGIGAYAAGVQSPNKFPNLFCSYDEATSSTIAMVVVLEGGLRAGLVP